MICVQTVECHCTSLRESIEEHGKSLEKVEFIFSYFGTLDLSVLCIDKGEVHLRSLIILQGLKAVGASKIDGASISSYTMRCPALRSWVIMTVCIVTHTLQGAL